MLANQYIFKHIFDVFQVIHDISQADSGEYTCRIMVRERDIISLTHQVSVASAFTVKPVHKIFPDLILNALPNATIIGIPTCLQKL